MTARRCRGIAIGGSAGALPVVIELLRALPPGYPVPVAVCLHVPPDNAARLADCLRDHCRLAVEDARDKSPLRPGHVHVAPADHHLLVERNGTLALSVDGFVHFSRPSIDVLFHSAARAWGGGALAILLSGANEDGAAGLATTRSLGGVAVAQDPSTAALPLMPRSGIANGAAELVLAPARIAALLLRLHAMPPLRAAAGLAARA